MNLMRMLFLSQAFHICLDYLYNKLHRLMKGLNYDEQLG